MFEYKFVLLFENNVIKWQNSANNIFNLQKLQFLIKQQELHNKADSSGMSP